MFKQICQKWYTAHVDLFASHLNHKVPLYVYPVPNHRNSSRLARDALVLGLSAALNRDPTLVASHNNSSQTVPQLCVLQQSSTSQPPHLVSRSGQLQEQVFSVEVAERITALNGHQQGPSTSQSGPFLRNGAEKIRWISQLPLRNKSQTSSCICTKI